MMTWRAEFFESIDDNHPVRSTIIEAATEREAADKAAALMGTCSSVSVVRTILAKPSQTVVSLT
jgi:hypothetical protein